MTNYSSKWLNMFECMIIYKYIPRLALNNQSWLKYVRLPFVHRAIPVEHSGVKGKKTVSLLVLAWLGSHSFRKIKRQ